MIGVMLILLQGLFLMAGDTQLQANVELKIRPNKDIYSQCVNCHRQKNYSVVPSKHQPLREHSEIKLAHGNKEMSCNHCHDKNKHNFLKALDGHTVSFRAPSQICYQCHSDVYKSWENNIHGKRVGSWRDKRVQLHCTECHNPHSVPFKKMKAEPPPKRPKHGIPKGHD